MMRLPSARVLPVLLLTACSGAELTVTPTTVDFGTIDFQQPRPDEGYDQTPITIQNTGKKALDVWVENDDDLHVLVGVPAISQDPPTLATMEPGGAAQITVAVWDYDVEGGERDTTVTGEFRIGADGLRDPVVVSWSFVPTRNIGGDTGS